MTSPDLPHTVDAVDSEYTFADLAFERGVADLDERYGRLLGARAVSEILAESFRALAARGVDLPREHAIALRFAGARLRARAEIEGAERPAGSPTRVMFVCVQNAGRSQMAAAMLAAKAGAAVEVCSAGSAPAEDVHEAIAPVLERFDADPLDVFPKPVSPEMLMAADYVVTMGCGDGVDAGSDTDVRDWPVTDPADAGPQEVEEIAADIERRVDALWDEIRTAKVPAAAH